MTVSKGKANPALRQYWQRKVSAQNIGFNAWVNAKEPGNIVQGEKKKMLNQSTADPQDEEPPEWGIGLGAERITLPFCCSIENRIWKPCQVTGSRIQGLLEQDLVLGCGTLHLLPTVTE
ncbi:hypothetical protein STEG23_031218 [Scotinomys teguina]